MMLSHQLTHSRRSLGTDWWPFPVPGMTPPSDPLQCLARYPQYTWDSKNSRCVDMTAPAPSSTDYQGAVWQAMQSACAGLGCRWNYSRWACECGAGTGPGTASAIAPQTSGNVTSCPAGSMPIPTGLPGAGTCFPVSGPNIPAWPWAPPGSQTPVNPNVPVPPTDQQPAQQQAQPSWWSQQTDTTKALVIGGGAVAAIGLVLLLTSSKEKGPAIVYTSGVPQRV
jgi:hypothetical protein